MYGTYCSVTVESPAADPPAALPIGVCLVRSGPEPLQLLEPGRRSRGRSRPAAGRRARRGSRRSPRPRSRRPATRVNRCSWRIDDPGRRSVTSLRTVVAALAALDRRRPSADELGEPHVGPRGRHPADPCRCRSGRATGRGSAGRRAARGRGRRLRRPAPGRRRHRRRGPRASPAAEPDLAPADLEAGRRPRRASRVRKRTVSHRSPPSSARPSARSRKRRPIAVAPGADLGQRQLAGLDNLAVVRRPPTSPAASPGRGSRWLLPDLERAGLAGRGRSAAGPAPQLLVLPQRGLRAPVGPDEAVRAEVAVVRLVAEVAAVGPALSCRRAASGPGRDPTTPR